MDEIIGSFNSLSTTPNPTRLDTPALSEADPGTEIEVRLEDLLEHDIQGVNWSNFSVSREDYRNIRYGMVVFLLLSIIFRIQEYREFDSDRRNTLDILPEEDDCDRLKTYSPLGPMLSFRYMNKVDSCNVPHFQLRHLMCCPTTRSVIFPRKYIIQFLLKY